VSQNAAIFGYHAPLKKALRPVNVEQKNKSSTMLSSKVHSMGLPMDCTAWRLWMMRQ